LGIIKDDKAWNVPAKKALNFLVAQSVEKSLLHSLEKYNCFYHTSGDFK